MNIMSAQIIHYLYGHFWGPEEMKQNLWQNTYEHDEQSFQCTCTLYKKYSPITVKYSNILHHTHYKSSVCFLQQAITAAENLLATWKYCLHPYTNCLLPTNVNETWKSVVTFIRNCTRPMPTYYVKNKMGYVENRQMFLCKLKTYMLFIQDCKWV
jgi:hypothetical protein